MTSEVVEERINRVLTQYRESPKLLFVMLTYRTKLAEMSELVETLPGLYDLTVAVVHQLPILGRRVGWPRSPCVFVTQTVFGF